MQGIITPECPACGCPTARVFGQLGKLWQYQCRDCGSWYNSTTPVKEFEYEE